MQKARSPGLSIAFASPDAFHADGIEVHLRVTKDEKTNELVRRAVETFKIHGSPTGMHDGMAISAYYAVFNSLATWKPGTRIPQEIRDPSVKKTARFKLTPVEITEAPGLHPWMICFAQSEHVVAVKLHRLTIAESLPL